MSFDFNADEIFEMAEQIEINGAKFYRDMSAVVSDEANRKLFLDFAAMEDQHRKTFAAMRSDLSAKEREPTAFDPNEEASQYLSALADLRVFDKTAEEDFVIPDDLSEQEKKIKIFKAALGREKDSVVFYLGMKELVGKSLGRDKIDGIIKEELTHIRLLAQRLTASRG